ncbi:PH domain-containing protein [Citricoccus sp. NR2]|uniref:PH domain-containing protein n=1 Tax=Citricoccus sp. NR2 TaxID=3004095 RepID=UPI002FD2D0DA
MDQPAPEAPPTPETPPTPQAVEPPAWSDPDAGTARGLDDSRVDWRPVSPKLVPLRLITGGISTLVWTAILAIPLILKLAGVWPGLWDWTAWGLPAASLLFGIVELCIVPRQVRAMGYAEREDDFLIKRGILFREVVAIPYGRLQYLDVSDGPLQRGFGLRTLKISTAASDTSGELTGVPQDEAERLREQLTARGQARLAGL